MKAGHILLSFCLAAASLELVSAAEQSLQVMKTRNAGSELQVEARQVQLAQIINKIASETGVPIHYSALPEERVTATCVGATVKQVMECLLDRKADVIFRYPQQSAKDNSDIQPLEVWVLGTRFDTGQKQADCTATEAQGSVGFVNRDPEEAKIQAVSIKNGADPTEKLLAMARSQNPAQRADAISALMTGGRAGDAKVRKALETALSDKNADVRAQAISSLAHREGEGATVALQQALQDRDASVRLMAVESADNDPALFQQALNDSDETVRTLAAMKLEALSKR
jgi:hypothetical protein